MWPQVPFFYFFVLFSLVATLQRGRVQLGGDQEKHKSFFKKKLIQDSIVINSLNRTKIGQNQISCNVFVLKY